jgi:hypothetical protein
VDWIDRLIDVTEARAHFPSERERDELLAVFRKGQEYYRTLS